MHASTEINSALKPYDMDIIREHVRLDIPLITHANTDEKAEAVIELFQHLTLQVHGILNVHEIHKDRTAYSFKGKQKKIGHASVEFYREYKMFKDIQVLKLT